MAKIESGIEWPVAGSGFAHLYGQDLGDGEVYEIKEYKRGEQEDWYSLLGNDSWLA